MQQRNRFLIMMPVFLPLNAMPTPPVAVLSCAKMVMDFNK